MRIFYALLVFSAVLLTPASSQQVGEALVVSACGTPGRTLTAGQLGPTTVDTTGALCSSASGGGGGGSVTQGTVPWVVSNAGTFAVQASESGTWTVQPGNTANTTPWLVTGSGTAGTAASGVLSVQGIASMTPLLVTPAANSAVNVAQVNGTTVLTNTGAVGTGSMRVAVGTDTATIAGSAPGTAGTASSNVVSVQGISSMTPVQVSQATASNLNATVVGTGTLAVQPGPSASGGLSTYFVQPTASDNHANIKNGAGLVYHVSATNNSATINYVRFYDAATGFNGCNSATNLVYQIAVPASTSGAGFVQDIAMGLTFSTGISVCVTSGYATNDTTNATASAMSVTVGYK